MIFHRTHVNIYNEQIKGKIEILKVNAKDDSPLAGAKFTLYDASGTEIATATSDSNGIASFDGIPYGKYTIKETESPNGFILSDEILDAEITDHGQVIQLTMKNSEKPDVPHTGVPSRSPIVPILIAGLVVILIAAWFTFNKRNRRHKKSN